MRKLSGFTLIEVQIAIVILLLIVAVVMGGLRLASKSTQAAEKVANQSTELRVISRLLINQISSIVPLKTLDKGKNKVLFKGANSSLYYMGHLPEKALTGGPWFIHLHRQNNELVLSYKVFDNTRSMQDNMKGVFESISVLDGVVSFSVHYQKETGQWLSSWRDNHTLPKTIKISLKQTGLEWPALIMPLYSHAATITPFHVLTIKSDR